MKTSPKRAQPKPPTAQQKLDALGIDGLCVRITAGENQVAIARSLDISAASVVNWLAADPERSARAREARMAAAQAFDAKAEEVLSGAKTAFDLAKARELAHHYRWKASKANPREYGDKLEHTGPNGGAIQVQSTVTFVRPPPREGDE